MQVLTKTELFARLQDASAATNAYIAASPQWVQVWILIMTLVLVPAFIFGFRKTEARWIVLGLLQTVVFTPFLIATAGPSKVWGLTHIMFWTGPMIVGFAGVLRDGIGDWYHRWLALAAGVMAISLAFDVVDVVTFLRSAG
ncbi:MAG: hypothetical protein ACRETN_00500 [Nevskiales bacterium]